jgi:hypothetical protein
LKESKAYTDEQIKLLGESGGAGREETKTLKWNDTMETPVTQTNDERGRMVKVSDDVIDLASLKSFSYASKLAGSGEHLGGETIPCSEFTAVACSSGGTNFVAYDMVWIWCVSADEAGEDGASMVGTWFCNTDNDDTSVSICMTAELETIHPIDPKFIPGAVLPVVEIADVSAITAEESAKLTACIGMPCIINVNGAVVIVHNYVLEDGVHCFVPTTEYAYGAIVTTDGVTWVIDY